MQKEYETKKMEVKFLKEAKKYLNIKMKQLDWAALKLNFVRVHKIQTEVSRYRI